MLFCQYIDVFLRLGSHKKDTTTTKTSIDRLGGFAVHRSWAISF